MIVTKKNTAIPKYPSAISQPTSKAQIRLAIGCFSNLISTSLPNGNKTKPANLKHCVPKGIPMMVIESKIPKINHKIAAINPPKNKPNDIAE